MIMINYKTIIGSLAVIAAAVLFVSCSSSSSEKSESSSAKEKAVTFEQLEAYQDWAKQTGYKNGTLVAQGPDGVNKDYYHTSADSAAYTSGRIVIGDSRCCQIGIYEQRKELSDAAVFAVWGGHYKSSEDPPIMTNTLLSEAEACFKKQVEAVGSSTVWVFATVNDYDFKENNNTENIKACIEAAEKIASFSAEKDGKTVHPKVIVVGFDGCWDTAPLYGTPQEEFNAYVSDYNKKLKEAVEASELLKADASLYAAVPEIAGGKAKFIDDGLHYHDTTLEAIIAHIRS